MSRSLLLLLPALVLLAVPPPAHAATAAYPDLRTLPPRDMRFDVTTTDRGAGRTVLRFTNTVWNAGEGDLRVGGVVDPDGGTAPAMQTVANDDGTSSSHVIGSYVIHPEHQHFHYDSWGRYELWTKAAHDRWVAAGRPASTQPDMVGTKTTSCMLDMEIVRELPATPYPRRWHDRGCDPTSTGRIDSGLAPGWGDTYDHERVEQWIDLGTRLADGEYVLRSVADPLNKVHESENRADPARESAAANEATSLVRVVGGQIQDLERPTGTITANGVDDATSSTNVVVRALGRDDVSGVDRMRLSNDGVTWRTFTEYGGSVWSPMTIAWDLADTRYGGSTAHGPRTVYAQFRDRSGKWSASTTDTIELRTGTTDPGGGNSLYREAVLSSSPAAWWRLGEQTGTTARDERGANTGAYAGTPTLGVASLLGSDVDTAARFAGASSMNVASTTGLLPTSNVSLEAWIRPDELPATGRFASVLTKPEAWSLQFNGPLLEFTIIQDGVRRRLQAPSGTVQPRETHHVLGTYNGLEQRLYVDGVEVARRGQTGPASSGWAGLHVGSWDGRGEFFSGTIDEPAVYATTLTGLQAKQHHDAGISTAVGVPAPTGLAATAASSSRVDLRWSDRSGTETGFVVQRSTSSSFAAPTEIRVGANVATYADTGLSPSTTYFYRVKAVTATDDSAWSAAASATTPAAQAAAPAAPSGLTATAASSSRIDLRWTDNAAGETGFVVERSSSSSFASPTAVTVGADVTTYADTGRTAGTTTWYRVRAVDGALASAWSAVASATTPAAPPPPPPSDYPATVAADAPVSHWRLGETSGTTAADVRAANPGVFRNGVTLGAPSLLVGTNAAALLDGGDDHVEVRDAASLDLTSAFSLEAWLRPTRLPAAGGWASVLTKAESWALQFNGPRLEFTLMQSGARRRLLAPATALAAGRTSHVVATYDGASQRLYVDGALVASRAQTGAATVTTWPVSVGSWSGLGEHLQGRVDEVAVYGRTLSAARVQAHFAAGRPATAAAARRRAATSAARTRTRAGRAKARMAVLGPAQRLTAGLRGPGDGLRRRLRRCTKRHVPAAASGARRIAAAARLNRIATRRLVARMRADARRACTAARRR